MFIEHRTYTLKPGSTGAYIDAYREADGLALHETMAPCVGWYTVEAGDLFRLVTMWRFESLEDRDEGRKRLYDQPAWCDLMSTVQPLVTDIRSQLLTPTAFWARTPRGRILTENSSDA
jgi:hypothetical protein